jgi:hypothetical protein
MEWGLIPDRSTSVFAESIMVLGPTLQLGPESIFQDVKRQGREADHSSPYRTEVKTIWSYSNSLKYMFIA